MFHLERTFTAVNYSQLFCAQFHRSKSWEKNNQAALVQSIQLNCLAYHRLNNGGLARKNRLLTEPGTVGEALVATHTAWPALRTPQTQNATRRTLAPLAPLHPKRWKRFENWTCWHGSREPATRRAAYRKEITCDHLGAKPGGQLGTRVESRPYRWPIVECKRSSLALTDTSLL